MTNAKSYSYLPEIFTTDFKKLNVFCMNFFPPGVTRIKEVFFLFLFLTVWTYFSSKMFDIFWEYSMKSLEFVKIFVIAITV